MVIALNDEWIWDSWYLHDGETWHAYFLKAPKSLEDPELRHWNVSQGHATSTDLMNWTHLGTCLKPAHQPAWDDYTTWTGSTIRDEAGGWHLFYTGSTRAEDGMYQRIGHATSEDGHNWDGVGDGMCLDLTGLDLASASLLDEGTAAAEAMALAKRVSKNKKSNAFFVAEEVYPQTISVVKNRAEFFGFDIIVAPAATVGEHDVFGALLQYPTATGEIVDIRPLIEAVQEKKGIVAVAADIMSLVLLKAPGELGADVVIGSSQRFGVPMGYGGPHAAFFTTSDKYKR